MLTREALHNRPTRYELIAERGETRVLVAYCMRTSRNTILSACQKHGQQLIDFMGLTDKDLFVFVHSLQGPFRYSAQMGPSSNPWSIRFSGRTQRDCVGSELPWIGNPKEAA